MEAIINTEAHTGEVEIEIEISDSGQVIQRVRDSYTGVLVASIVFTVDTAGELVTEIKSVVTEAEGG